MEDLESIIQSPGQIEKRLTQLFEDLHQLRLQSIEFAKVIEGKETEIKKLSQIVKASRVRFPAMVCVYWAGGSANYCAKHYRQFLSKLDEKSMRDHGSLPIHGSHHFQCTACELEYQQRKQAFEKSVKKTSLVDGD